MPDKEVRHWEIIRKQLLEEEMPPEDEAQLSKAERAALVAWIDGALQMARTSEERRRAAADGGAVPQHIARLAGGGGGFDRDVAALRGVERFVSNGQAILLSPLLVETYFEIAERALDLAIVDPQAKPVIQNFRMDLGYKINPEPCPDSLILGANSALLANDNFIFTQEADGGYVAECLSHDIFT